MEQEDTGNRNKLEKPLGVAFQMGQLAVRSDGVLVVFPKQDEQLEKRIRKAYKDLRRKMPGSVRYEKQRKYLASLHEKRVNQRRDALHKAARQIANAGDAIYVERPEIRKRLAKLEEPAARAQLLDEAWWTFSDLIRYKAEGDGKRFWTVATAFPIHRLCSGCDHLMPEMEHTKLWHCSQCGLSLPAALNAAKNLENLGREYIRAMEKEKQN